MTTAADDIIDLYRRHADAWANRRGDRLREGKWLDRFLALQPEPPSVLDIGCGSGLPIAAHLAAQGCTVTGIDSSPELLAHAQSNVPSAQFHHADMRDFDLGETFTGLLAWNSMFHLTPEDQRLMFALFARHAKPGAALMFTSGPGHGSALGEFEGDVLYHGSLAPEEYQNLLANHGFDLIDHAVEDPNCGHLTIWLAQHRVANPLK